MGAIKGEGLKNQLGRPTLDLLTLLVREAAQNSWDAGDPDREGPVRFELDLRHFGGEDATAWRELLTVGAPDAEALPLRSVLDAKTLAILFVSDRGTTGLGGPTRADEAMQSQLHDYVSFVLNSGEPRDTDLGGGTYGFGKAVFYTASAASTILIHTRCRTSGGAIESRVIGCALGQSLERAGQAQTGRHWFGLEDGPEIVEPVRGDAADEIAERLAFPAFASSETGTTIAVIAPDLSGRAPADAAAFLARSLLWHLWPKMRRPDDGAPAMQFGVAYDGVECDLGDPATHPAIGRFVAALDTLDEDGVTVTHGPDRKSIGKLALQTSFSPPPSIDEVGQAAGLGEGIHHCCLMRTPELVVAYLPGPPMPDKRISYAGVFKAPPELDEVFASAEPPTHDAWSPENLPEHDRSIVRVALRKIDAAMRKQASPDGGTSMTGVEGGLGAVSRFLGTLLAPTSGLAAGAERRTPQGERRTTAPSVENIGGPRWTRRDGHDVLFQEFAITPGRTVTVDARATVRIWGGTGTEADPPAGASGPTLVGWLDPDDTFHPPGRIAITGAEHATWRAIVAAPPDTAVRISIREATASNDDA